MAESEVSSKFTISNGQSSKKSFLVSSGNDWQKNVLCRFYMNGMCNKGSECIYSHDRSLSNRGTLPCKYFTQGTCAYGDNCRFSHGQPFPGDLHDEVQQEDQINFLRQQVNPSHQFNLEGPHVTPIYPPQLNPPQQTDVSVNDSTMIRQYDVGYEPSSDFRNFIVEDSHPIQHVQPDTNSFYNEGTIGGDSGVEDLTYQFDTSLTLEQVPSAPDPPMAITPTGVLWPATGPYRSVTPGITSSPYSPPPFSDTSWAEAPEFVPRNMISPSASINSQNAIKLQSPVLEEVSSNATIAGIINYSSSSNQEGQHAGSGMERQSVMSLSLYKPTYNVPLQLPSLIPSITTSGGIGNNFGAIRNIHDNGTPLQNTDLTYVPCMVSTTPYSTSLEHFSPLINSQKHEMSQNEDRPQFNQQSQHQQQRNFQHKQREMPPPPPPPPQGDNTIGPSGIITTLPKIKTWAQVVNGSLTTNNQGTNITQGTFNTIGKAVIPSSIADAESQLCPFSLVGECRYGEHCAYVHGLVCDLCGTPSLHPNHEKQRKRHQEECMNQHEVEMELAFAVARSKDKTCGICMEVVMDKSKGEARFGIMPNCNHCYCLTCLRKWRQAKQFEHKIIRACPECRQTSDYICPSRYWIDTKEEKERLLSNYKVELKKKECKYFDKGNGECPFGNKCFYRHEDNNGKIVDVGPPSAQTINRPRLTRGAPSADDPLDADGSDRNLVQRLLLFDFLEERDGRVTIQLDEFLDILDFLSDTEESDDFESYADD